MLLSRTERVKIRPPVIIYSFALKNTPYKALNEVSNIADVWWRSIRVRIHVQSSTTPRSTPGTEVNAYEIEDNV